MDKGNKGLASVKAKYRVGNDNSQPVSNKSMSAKANKASDLKEQKASNQDGNDQEIQTLLNKKLVELCFSKSLDLNATMELLKNGAEASWEECEDGTWGAFKKRSAINGVLRRENYVNRATAELAIFVVRELFQYGANPNAAQSHSDWRGSGSSISAFTTVLSLTQSTALKDHDDLSASLIKMFLDAGVDVNKESVQHISSMRSDGVIRSTVLHDNIGRYSASIIRELLVKADVDHRKTGFIQNERGWDEDFSETALHNLCKSVGRKERVLQDDRRYLQIANALLEFGANPNSLNTWLDNVPNPEYDDVDNPREEGYIAEVISERVIERPLYRALKSRLAPLVWLLISRGAITKGIHVRCSRANYILKTYSAKNFELDDGLKKFYSQDRRPGDVIRNSYEVHQNVWEEFEDSSKETSPMNNKKSIEEIDNNLLKFSEEKRVMHLALRGEWSKSFNQYLSEETKNLIGIIQNSRLTEVVQDLVISFFLSMHPISSNLF